MNVAVNIKAIKWHNENLLTLTCSNKLEKNYVAVLNYFTHPTLKINDAILREL